ncbi:MAG: phytanoyl-CoA dioxygenase family protein [Methanobacteriota archaeon]|nr:MAG: phytanoyl-CoA dioxygenase family protein [Euryarchaeota archaeon]
MVGLSPEDVEKFRRDGYLLIRNLFSADELDSFKDAIFGLRANPSLVRSSRNSIVFRGSLFNYRVLESVPFDDRILDVARSILGSSFAYFGDSSVQMGQGPRGLHRDSTNRVALLGPDWEGEYPLLRMGIYIGDFTRNSGGLKIVPRSHLPLIPFAPPVFMRILKRLTRFLTPPFRLARKLVAVFQGGFDVPSQSGDLIIWNFRLLHSGNAVKLKRYPRFALPVWLENAAPESWRLPGNRDRMVMFCAFAREGAHLERYLRARRETDLTNLKWTRWDASFQTLASAKRVRLFKPDPEVGVLYQGREPEESGAS